MDATDPTNLSNRPVPFDKLGYPGARGGLLSAPNALMSKKAPDSSVHKVMDDTEREFVVEALLAKDVSFQQKITFDVRPDMGASFLNPPAGATVGTVYTPVGPMRLYLNALGEIAMISGRVTAPTIHEAYRQFTFGLLPFLDQQSYEANVPILISRVKCSDAKNAAEWIEYVTPYYQNVMKVSETEVEKAIWPVFSLYREAKNATSSYYKFLCYFKIMEGIYSDLRPKLFAAAKAKGVAITTSKERVPAHAELEKDWPDEIGKPIKALFDGQFRDEYRDAVAHAVKDGHGWLLLSDLSTDYKFAGSIVLLELCCREVIDTHLNYMAQLRMA